MSNVMRPSPPRRIARVGVAACIVLAGADAATASLSVTILRAIFDG